MITRSNILRVLVTYPDFDQWDRLGNDFVPEPLKFYLNKNGEWVPTEMESFRRAG